MKTTGASRFPWRRKIYALALHALPAAFRRRHAEEMLHVFEEGLHDARAKGARARFRHGLAVAGDLAASSLREHLESGTFLSLTAWLPAFAVGCAAAYVDFHATEVQATLLVLLNGNFVVGCVQPHRVWRRAFLVALLLPTAHIVAFASGGQIMEGHPYLSRALIFLPAATASLLGAYAGVFGRFAWSKLA